MSEPLFAASYMKIDRARKFTSELEREQERYAEDDPIAATIKMEGPAPYVDISLKGTGLLPGAIVGDAVHNLRAALDLMASEMATINNRSNKDVYFPFSADEASFPESIKKNDLINAD